MWITTTIGFFSAVQKRNTDFVTIRARARGDLDRLRERYLPELSETMDHVGTDYQYRATATHEQWANALSQLCMDLDYGNFKNAVAREMGWRRERVYHEVWATMSRIDDG